jgi:hypothetical protein
MGRFRKLGRLNLNGSDDYGPARSFCHVLASAGTERPLGPNVRLFFWIGAILLIALSSGLTTEIVTPSEQTIVKKVSEALPQKHHVRFALSRV